MKTVVKNGTYASVSNVEADKRVSQGWSFCSKSEWKKTVVILVNKVIQKMKKINILVFTAQVSL
jgi:hypothetical protein